jgi:hypothetical protein
MAGKGITQAEARRYRAEANRLRDKLRHIHKTWGCKHVEGTVIASVEVDEVTLAKVQTAGALNHAVAVSWYGRMLYFHAMPAPAEQSE